MLHYRFANATHILLCRSNPLKLESMKKKSNNTHPHTLEQV
jgi:hypothetical protein